MTTPDERTRALVWAGGFLIELARDRSLSLDVRRRAVVIARHFPTIKRGIRHGPIPPSHGPRHGA